MMLETIQYNTIGPTIKKLMFAPSYSNYHEGAMMSCNMPWWTVQSWVGLPNVKISQTATKVFTCAT